MECKTGCTPTPNSRSLFLQCPDPRSLCLHCPLLLRLTGFFGSYHRPKLSANMSSGEARCCCKTSQTGTVHLVSVAEGFSTNVSAHSTCNMNVVTHYDNTCCDAASYMRDTRYESGSTTFMHACFEWSTNA